MALWINDGLHEAAADIHSFLLVGQSNMAGRGDLTKENAITAPDCFMLRMGRWQEMSEPINVDRAVVEGAVPRSGANLAASFAAQLQKEQKLLLDYARMAVTEENVALLAKQALAARRAVPASTLAAEYPDDFARIIGLHTYSQSPRRDYDIELTGNWVERGGFRFEEFILTPRKEEPHGRNE